MFDLEPNYILSFSTIAILAFQVCKYSHVDIFALGTEKLWAQEGCAQVYVAACI